MKIDCNFKRILYTSAIVWVGNIMSLVVGMAWEVSFTCGWVVYI